MLECRCCRCAVPRLRRSFDDAGSFEPVPCAGYRCEARVLSGGLRRDAAPARNSEILLKYAQAAAAAEDYEGAITAYERFLVIDADQPRVKFELGVLYYKLKSYDAARTYFDQARNSAKASKEVAERSSEFIRDIDRR